jgi:hypothetical protein
VRDVLYSKAKRKYPGPEPSIISVTLELDRPRSLSIPLLLPEPTSLLMKYGRYFETGMVLRPGNRGKTGRKAGDRKAGDRRDVHQFPFVEQLGNIPSVPEVRLGQSAGILEGRVIDVNTGAAIAARLLFYDRNGNQHFLMVKGEYRALLAPGKDIGLMLSSPKFESRMAFSRLQLEPGQRVHLDIPLSKE